MDRRSPSPFFVHCLISFLGSLLILCAVKVDSSLYDAINSGCLVQDMTAHGMTDDSSSNSPLISLRWKWTCKYDSAFSTQVQLTDSKIGQPVSQTLNAHCYEKTQNCEVRIFYFNPTAVQQVAIEPCASYSIRVENSNAIVQIPPRRQDLEPSGIVVTVQGGLGTNIMFSVSFPQLHPRCADELYQSSVILETGLTPANLSCSLIDDRPSSKICSLTIPAPAFDLCNENRPVQVSLLYNGYERLAVWFNAALQPRRTNSSVSKEKPTVNSNRPEELTISWNDPECLVSTIESWRLLFYKIPTNNGRAEYEVTIPNDCVVNRAPSRNRYQHHLALIKGQRINCGRSQVSENYFLGFEPCSAFTIDIVPQTRAGSLDRLTSKALQQVNFTTPLDPSKIENLVAKNVTSTSFQLEWGIPSQCKGRTFTVPARINNEHFEIQDAIVGTCRSSCPMKKNIENLTPCTRYSVSMGLDEKVTIVTLPGRKDLLPTLLVNVSLKEKSNTDLDLNIMLRNMSPNCADLITSVELRFDKSSLTSTRIPCVSSKNQSSERICSEIINVAKSSHLNLCKAHRLEIRPIYSEGIFREKINVPWIETNFGPLTVPHGTQIQLKEQLPYVVEWNNPACLLAEVSYWHVRVYDKSTGRQFGPYFWYLPDQCSRDVSVAVGGQRQGFQHRAALSKEPLPSCSASYLHERDSELSSCSFYSVTVTPIIGRNIELEELSLQVGLVTPFKSDAIGDLMAVNITNTSLAIRWSIPSKCSEKSITKVEVNGVSKPIEPTDLTVVGEDSQRKTLYWKNAEVLSPCTQYHIRMGSKSCNAITLPDPSTGSVNRIDVDPANLTWTKISWRPPTCHLKKILRWHLQLRNESDTSTAVINDASQMFYDVNSDQGTRQGRSFDNELLALEPCKTYQIGLRAEWDGSASEYWTEQSFTAPCNGVNRSGAAAAGVIAFIALILAIILGVRVRRSRQKQTPPTIIPLRSPESKSAQRGSKRSPLTLNDLCQVDAETITREFSSLKKIAEAEMSSRTRSAAAKPENKIKNRFNNIHPYDFNRVILSTLPADPHSDYINASFIPGFNGEKEFIAAQGPKRETVNDFWRMIWEQNVKMVVMVTTLREDGRTKCEQYWPDKGASTSFGEIQLKLLDETVHSFYAARTISASKPKDGKRVIKQLHFTAWSDYDSPDEAEELIQFVEILRQELRTMNDIPPPPILVHCSAGVGRTGTLITIDHLIQQVQIIDTIDIFKIVLNLRRFRVSMVQSESQYVFVYACLAHYVKTRLQLGANDEPVYENVKAGESTDFAAADGFENLEYENIRLAPYDD